MKSRFRMSLVLLSLLLLLPSCGETEAEGYVDRVVLRDLVSIEDEAVALEASPAPVAELLRAEASGVDAKRSADAVIDYSNIDSGYVMVQYTTETDRRIKAQVKGPTTTYTYNVTPGKWEVFPISEGSGVYTISIFRNVTGTKYASVLSCTPQVNLTDEFAPFLYPNQYVDYGAAPNTVAKAAELTKDLTGTLEKVTVIYDYVVKNLTYDKEKAASVKSGYLPVLDEVLEKKTGICFDYAALMTGMLRSLKIPCKLVVGYADTAYHAWIHVWSEETGWVDGAIFFDGTSWQRMDPTFASSGNKSAAIMQYIGNGSHYTAKYLY